MKTVLYKNVSVTVLSNSEDLLKDDILTNANVMMKRKKFFIMPPEKHNRIYAKNPFVFSGEFFSSRQRQDGKISLHAVIDKKNSDILEVYKLAQQELNEFFTKLIVMK